MTTWQPVYFLLPKLSGFSSDYPRLRLIELPSPIAIATQQIGSQPDDKKNPEFKEANNISTSTIMIYTYIYIYTFDLLLLHFVLLPTNPSINQWLLNKWIFVHCLRDCILGAGGNSERRSIKASASFTANVWKNEFEIGGVVGHTVIPHSKWIKMVWNHLISLLPAWSNHFVAARRSSCFFDTTGALHTTHLGHLLG